MNNPIETIRRERDNDYSYSELLVVLLAEYSTWIGISGIIVVVTFLFLLLTGTINVDFGEHFTLVNGLRLAGFLVGALGFGVWIALMIKRIWTTRVEYVEQVNVLDDPKTQTWYMSPDIWDKVDVVAGKSTTERVSGGRLKHRVRSFDPEKLEAEGWWMGEASDPEIMTKMSQIEANRGRNRTWARIGQTLYAKFDSIVQNIENAYYKQLSDDTMDSISNHPETVHREVEQDVADLRQSLETPDPVSIDEEVTEEISSAGDMSEEDVDKVINND